MIFQFENLFFRVKKACLASLHLQICLEFSYCQLKGENCIPIIIVEKPPRRTGVGDVLIFQKHLAEYYPHPNA
jgi:hypothetical protein